MDKSRSLLILVVLVGFGVSQAVPAEDLPETAYDESEALPYECTPLVSTTILPAAAQAVRSHVRLLHTELQAVSTFPAAHRRDLGAHRFANGRALSALLCILLC